MRTWIVLLVATAATAAGAQERTVTPVSSRIDLDSITALAVQLASCAALHAAAAEALERARMSDYAARARRRAELDQLVTAYLLAEDRVAKGGIRRDPAAFTTYVEDLTANARDRMAAVVAATDAAEYRREEAVCSSLTPLVDEVLAKITAP
jgi:hypothetical protein